MALERLKASLEAAPILDKGGYQYFVHPITDGVPVLEPAILEEIVDLICTIPSIKNRECDKIVGIEAMGIPIATGLALKTGLPMTIVRKRIYGLPGEVAVKQYTGYSKSDLYINGVYEKDRVILVDDVLSTGGTIAAVVEALQGMGVEIVETIIVVEKGDKKEEIEKKLGIKIRTIVRIKVENGKVVVLNTPSV